MIEAKVVADSKNPISNDRITTMIVTMPRMILAEFNTHRMFSRNSASSRAIPFKKMVKTVQENPFIPIAWQKDHKGMQGTEYLDERESEIAKSAWLLARNRAIEEVEYIHERTGATKQLCNRPLEAYMWHTVIVTSTEWKNFFQLRCPRYEIEGYRAGTFWSKKSALSAWSGKGNCPDINDTLGWLNINTGQAEIHMMALAEAMYDALNESTPKVLENGEWHIPFNDVFEKYEGNVIYNALARIKIATVMCARVSYTVVGEDQRPLSYERMIQIHDELLAANPKHLSPFEHCARVMNEDEIDEACLYDIDGKETKGISRNFKGFTQYRSLVDQN